MSAPRREIGDELARRLSAAIGPHVADDVDREQQLQLTLRLLAGGRHLNATLLSRVREHIGHAPGAGEAAL